MEGNRNHLHVWDSQTMVVMHLVLNINFAPSASPPSSECSLNTTPMILHYLDKTTTKSVTIHSWGLQLLTDLNLCGAKIDIKSRKKNRATSVIYILLDI